MTLLLTFAYPIILRMSFLRFRYLAQLQVASIEPIQLVLEATVGANALGNIAIDNISFRQGTCPSKLKDYNIEVTSVNDRRDMLGTGIDRKYTLSGNQFKVVQEGYTCS